MNGKAKFMMAAMLVCVGTCAFARPHHHHNEGLELANGIVDLVCKVLRPAPVVVAPAPAVVTPAPVVVTQPAVVTPAPVVVTQPAVVTPAPVVVTPPPVVVAPRPVHHRPAPRPRPRPHGGHHRR